MARLFLYALLNSIYDRFPFLRLALVRFDGFNFFATLVVIQCLPRDGTRSTYIPRQTFIPVARPRILGPRPRIAFLAWPHRGSVFFCCIQIQVVYKVIRACKFLSRFGYGDASSRQRFTDT